MEQHKKYIEQHKNLEEFGPCIICACRAPSSAGRACVFYRLLKYCMYVAA